MNNTVPKPLESTEIKITYYSDVITYNKIKSLAHWERKTIKEIMNREIDKAINLYELVYGPIELINKDE